MLVLLHFCPALFGQNKQDYNWIIGYDTSYLVPGGDAIKMNFENETLHISMVETVEKFHMEGSNSSMSDSLGNLLFYTNGCYIVNAEHKIMANGDTISPGILYDAWCDKGGNPLSQGAIAVPGSDHLFYVFTLDFEWAYLWDPYTTPVSEQYLELAPLHLYYQVIDMTQAGGLGAVVAKNQVAVADTLARANIQACRHANGRDWWVIVPESHSNCYYLILITPEGVQPPLKRCEGRVWSDLDWQGQAVFSPDATRYIRFNAWNGLNIYNFDNCTGSLSNAISVDFPNDTSHVAGAAVSPNSRFLYADMKYKVYQFDLWADDIPASQTLIAVWDGFFNPYATIFYKSALAPDGKIYISSTSSHRSLHVIHHPDLKGTACDLEQHGLALPAFNFNTIPNLPHYRNGPFAPCEPSGTEDAATAGDISVFPNPASRYFNIRFSPAHPPSDIRVFDLAGREKAHLASDVLAGRTGAEISLAGWPPGIYLVRADFGERQVVRKIAVF
ncbi:MAG TPA: T9SS type A sorting domain-containing protein [Flavilitoribacter sp.]|nr:T9SS type A sorting domain-containing protein [Flavilitoribacter sp.]HMQ86344.1 T9SS type A sorting domain-containing protein [Flavilitoribacter sp.]